MTLDTATKIETQVQQTCLNNADTGNVFENGVNQYCNSSDTCEIRNIQQSNDVQAVSQCVQKINVDSTGLQDIVQSISSMGTVDNALPLG